MATSTVARGVASTQGALHQLASAQSVMRRQHRAPMEQRHELIERVYQVTPRH
ncbi:hypothetical protein [Kushneria pakistanensis]|uniref:hypothetical protein n=1 Tax=Kushneria pakistanensis TaxID=1508770 RepID=UPI0016746E80|nr:hypothetical protein [Kushneria pakistanensis]